jgi:tripartite-type tricarboxylate transporter receptor subunit TctC
MKGTGRRRFLRLTGGAAIATTLAGCSGDGGSGGDGGDGGSGDGGSGDGGDGGSGDGGDGGSNFPNQEITWIVPYSTGGGFDTYSRGLAQYMPEYLPNDVNVVVQNQPGAGGRQGATQIYRADPNGYTFGIFNIPGMVASQIVQDTEYNLSEISWIGRVARSVYMLVVPASSEFETIEDLQNADEVSFAVTGPGSTSYLSAIIAANAMDISAEFVTGYSGSQESVAAALRGDVDAVQYPTSTPSIRNPIQEGDMRPIVYYAEEAPEWASAATPVTETDYADLAGQVNLQRCIGGPPEISEGRLNTLRTAFEETVTSDEFAQWAEDQGRPLDYASGAETGEIISNAQSTFEDYRDLLEERLQ